MEMVVGFLQGHMASSAQLLDTMTPGKVFTSQFVGLLVITFDKGHKNLEVDVPVQSLPL